MAAACAVTVTSAHLVEKVAKRRSRSAAAAIELVEYSIGSWYLCSKKRKRTAVGLYSRSTCRRRGARPSA